MKQIITPFQQFVFLACCLFPNGVWSQNIGINITGDPADPSAILDVKATDKGVLVPNVALISVNDIATIASPATSLLVYNTNAAITGGNGTGFYYYDGTKWTPIQNTSGSATGVTWPPVQVSNQTWAGVTHATCVSNCASYTGTAAGDGNYTDWRTISMDEYSYATLNLAAPTGGWGGVAEWWTRSWWGGTNVFWMVRESPLTGFSGLAPPYKCRCIR